jgi:hypothetical protein
MYSSHEADLDIPALPPNARRVHIVPALDSSSLVSIGQLCDSGCIVKFNATNVTVHYNDCLVLTGTRTPATRLWHIDPPTPPQLDSANGAVGSATPAEVIAFAHASLFSPALSTLEKAIDKGYLINFPGLTKAGLRKHPPRLIPMVKGHLDHNRQNQCSTKPKPAPTESPDNDFPSSPPDLERTHFCYASIMEPTGQIYTDLTGKFVSPSSNGNNVLFILYDYDSNLIYAEPIPNRSSASIVKAFTKLHGIMCKAGLRPKLQRLDNECDEALKSFMTESGIDFQLVPPNDHRRNAAERAIRTYKNHLIAGLCSTDKDFPLHLWDRLIPQCTLTLNLLRGS